MSDHPEIIEPIRKMLEDTAARPAVSARAKATRAVGFLEGVSMWLWQQVGPNLDDGIAAEVFGAWQNRCDEDVVDELADCIQACANMMAWMGLTQQDVDDAMLRCLKRNRDRGRIDAPWLA